MKSDICLCQQLYYFYANSINPLSGGFIYRKFQWIKFKSLLWQFLRLEFKTKNLKQTRNHMERLIFQSFSTTKNTKTCGESFKWILSFAGTTFPTMNSAILWFCRDFEMSFGRKKMKNSSKESFFEIEKCCRKWFSVRFCSEKIVWKVELELEWEFTQETVD